VGIEVSDLQRDILSVPVRYAGLGIASPMLTADREYETSKKVTASLKELIKQQDLTLDDYNPKLV
jgi:hypothetical protein